MRLLDQVAEWARSRRRPNESVTVQIDAGGITQITESARGTVRVHLAWDRVLSVYGFKRDCFTIDQICLLLGDDESDRWIEVTEDDSGYKALLEELPVRVQGFPCAEEWWRRVALPPFETQLTLLYRRPDSRDHSQDRQTAK